MDQLQFLTLLTQWGLGMLTLAIIGIVTMHVRISVFAQRLLDHIKQCEELHLKHDRANDSLWAAVDKQREKIESNK